MGGGGIMTGEDALEFMLVGADIVSVGTATMVDPRAIGIIANEMSAYCESQHIDHVSNLVGGIIMP